MKIDLFELHDPILDDKPKKWISGRGKELEKALKEIIEKLVTGGWTRVALSRHLTKKFNISKPTAYRLVYLRKEFYPLVFIKELLYLNGSRDNHFALQEKIEYLKVNQPPLKIVKAPKELTKNLCKIAGAHAADGTVASNFFCITDNYKSNIEAFAKWVEIEFGLKYKTKRKEENEWAVVFSNKIITRYLTRVFGFCNGTKVYSVGEPRIIKESGIEMRKAFAVGALTFEAGVGMKSQVEFCVASKNFRDDVCGILEKAGVKFHKMEKQSGAYWRFWSNSLTKEQTIKWMELFEPETEKWFKLYESVNGYKGTVKSTEEAITAFDKAYAHKQSSKVSMKNVLLAIKNLGKTHRYELANYLAKEANIESFGGKWAHSLKHYLDILKKASIIKVEWRRFGKKKSFGTIIREVYTFNPNISEWKVPLRTQTTFFGTLESPSICLPAST